MSLRIYFKKEDVLAISGDQQIGLTGICVVRRDVGGLFYTDAFQITDVLATTIPTDVLTKVAYASIKESWTGDALRQPGEYQNGEAHISVSYNETDRWPANNAVYGSSKNLTELVELFQAIKVGNAQRFLRRDYGKPQDGPSYAELETQLKAASAARKIDADLIRILTTAVNQQQQALRLVGRVAMFTKNIERHAEGFADPESARLFAEAVKELKILLAHDLAVAKADL